MSLSPYYDNFWERPVQPRRIKNDLEERLGKRYRLFLDRVVVRSLRDLLSSSDVDAADRATIERCIESGSFPVNVERQYHTSGTSLKGGEFYELTLFFGRISPKIFVKVYEDKKEYSAGKSLQDIVARVSDHVMSTTYFDDKLKVIATPFIHGVTLASVLEKASEEKDEARYEQALKFAIDVLSDLYVRGNKEKFAGKSVPEVIDNTGLFFKKFFLSSDPGIEKSTQEQGRKAKLDDILGLYKGCVGSLLDDRTHNRLIHGDAHPRNTLVSGEGACVDDYWQIDFDLALFGRTQLDLFRLFESSGVLGNSELKSRLIEYSYSKVRSVQPVSLQEFKAMYDLTEIQGLFASAGRYLFLARMEDHGLSFRKQKEMRELASLSYTLALNALSNLGNSGIEANASSQPVDAELGKRRKELANEIDLFVDENYNGLLRRLDNDQLARVRLNTSSSLSSLFNPSYDDFGLITSAERKFKFRRLASGVKRAVKITGISALVAGLFYVAIAGANSGDKITSAKLMEYGRKLDLLSETVERKSEGFFAPVIYDQKLSELVERETKMWVHPYIQGKNHTVFSQDDFDNGFIGRAPAYLGMARDNIFFSGKPQEIAIAMLYALTTKSYERQVLSKDRIGMALLLPSEVDAVWPIPLSNIKEKNRISNNDNLNVSVFGRLLSMRLVERESNIYDSFADCLLGKDEVNKAKFRSESIGRNPQDINQYWSFLKEGPEKIILARAIALYELFEGERHQEFVKSDGFVSFNSKLDASRLSRELLYTQRADLAESFKIPVKEMIKSKKYAELRSIYGNDRLAIAACYDRETVDGSIAFAGVAGVRSIEHYYSVRLQTIVDDFDHLHGVPIYESPMYGFSPVSVERGVTNVKTK